MKAYDILQQAASTRRIRLDDELELRYWTESLGISRTELRALVRSMGQSPRMLRSSLRELRSHERDLAPGLS